MIYITSYYLGICKIFYFLNRKKQIVITYHNIISDNLFDGDLIHLGVSCSESSFIKQFNIIRSRFTITTELRLPSSCIITFDDGYRNNIEIAVRILNDNNTSGLFFIPSSYFDKPNILWADQLLMWVSYVPTGDYLILGSKFSISSESSSRRSLWEYIYHRILSDYSVIKPLINNLDKNYSFNHLKKIINSDMYHLRFEPMTIDELDQLKIMGHKLGCHSFQHDILSLLNDEQLECDFLMCALHAKHYNTNFYSYPFGGIDEVSSEVIAKCQKYQYSAAFINDETDNHDIYSIGRLSLGNITDKYIIEAKLSGFERYFKKLLNNLNPLKNILLNLSRRLYGNKTAFRY